MQSHIRLHIVMLALLSLVHLRDMNGYQDLDLPSFLQEKYKDFPSDYYMAEGGTYDEQSVEQSFWDYSYFLKIKILEVYKGNKYDDTCISEILN